MNYNKLFENFEGRDAMLNKVTRYSLYDVMFYRTDINIHQKRVYWLTQKLMPYFKKAFPNIDETKALIIALIHDDAEIIMGDYQAGNKAKMTEVELKELDNIEEKAITEISCKFPKMIDKYVYKDLLLENLYCKTIETQIRKFTDKLDGYGESLHEIFAGNLEWIKNPVSEYGIIETGPEYYSRWLPQYTNIFPKMKQFYKPGFPLYNQIKMFDYKTAGKSGKPHTIDSLSKKTGYFPYDFWKDVMLKYSSSEELKYLYIQKEFN